MECYIKNYPRPQFVRKEWEDLNGGWAFAFDGGDSGERECWFKSFPSGMKINVPFTYETVLSGINDETPREIVWYERDLPTRPEAGKRAALHFEGSDYETKVWVNGIFIGIHTGGYARFSFDITGALAEVGANKLTVRVRDAKDIRQPRGKQRWTDYSFGCWYTQTTGIWKSVWLEYLPETHIRSVKMTPCLTSRSVTLEFEMSGGCAGFSLETAVSFGGKIISNTEALVTDSRLVVEVPVFNIAVGEWGLKTWGPGHPDLYDVRFTLKRDGEVADRVLSYFGMRDIRVREQDVLLNGAPLYQRLILNQGYWKDSGLTPPDEAAMIKDIEKIFAFGYNGARLHQKVEDERFLYWCDVMGLLVWSEAPAHYFFDDRAVKNFTAEWMEIVGQFYNHPSVITWVPFNESWGMPSVKTDKRQQHFQQAVYHWTKTYDANRPVIVNDGWEHTVSDILTLHDYQPSGDVFFEKYFNNQEAILSGKLCHDGTNAAFAEGFCYRGQPVVISEYGGIALDSGGVGWGYGNKAADEEDFLKRFESITGAIKKLPFVCGFCYTQLTDVQQEINGLMTMDRINKVDSEKIRAVNLKKTGKRMY